MSYLPLWQTHIIITETAAPLAFFSELQLAKRYTPDKYKKIARDLHDIPVLLEYLIISKVALLFITN
jgi:hypothetical protein